MCVWDGVMWSSPKLLHGSSDKFIEVRQDWGCV